jgi:hypothetical protein
MEALLEKEGKVENWNDDRLDELSRRIDAGFKEMREGFVRVDREMKEGFGRVDARFAQMDAKFDRVDARFDKLFIAIITVGGGFAATTIASLLGVLLL